MKDLNIADGDPDAHEVEVDLHMLRPLMLNGGRGWCSRGIHGSQVGARNRMSAHIINYRCDWLGHI